MHFIFNAQNFFEIYFRFFDKKLGITHVLEFDVNGENILRIISLWVTEQNNSIETKYPHETLKLF